MLLEHARADEGVEDALERLLGQPTGGLEHAQGEVAAGGRDQRQDALGFGLQ